MRPSAEKKGVDDTRVRWTQAAVGGVSVGLAVSLGAAGAARLLNLATVMAPFTGLGLPEWARFPVGLLELATAALLLIRSTRVIGAVAACALMIGGAVLHLATGVWLPIIVNVVLFGAAAWVASRSGGFSAGLRRAAGGPTR